VAAATRAAEVAAVAAATTTGVDLSES
jgi:hypothetical protein